MTSTTMPPSAERTPSRKRRRRGIRGAGERTDEQKKRLRRLRGQVQSSQRLGTDVLLPEDERAATSCSQHLLGAPERVGRLGARNCISLSSGSPR